MKGKQGRIQSSGQLVLATAYGKSTKCQANGPPKLLNRAALTDVNTADCLDVDRLSILCTVHDKAESR